MKKEKINTKLQKLRIENGYTYQQMAEKVGISKAYYWQLEHNNRRLYYDIAIKIAKIFQLKPDDIFFNWVKKMIFS